MVRSIASSAATLPIVGGSGRFSDINNENWPCVRPSGRNTSSKRRANPRAALIQILSTPTYFPADSKPYAFDSFTLLGHITARLWDDNLGLQPTGTLPFAAANPSSARTNQLPLDRDVVQFGSGE